MRFVLLFHPPSPPRFDCASLRRTLPVLRPASWTPYTRFARGEFPWSPGYAISQRARKRVEEIFGWMKAVGGFRRTRFRGLERTQLAGYFVGAAYNLLRIARLLAA